MFPAIKRDLIKFFPLRNNDLGRFCWIVCQALLFRWISLCFYCSLGVAIYLCVTELCLISTIHFVLQFTYFPTPASKSFSGVPLHTLFSPWEKISSLLHEPYCKIMHVLYHLERLEDIKNSKQHFPVWLPIVVTMQAPAQPLWMEALRTAVVPYNYW